MAVPLCLYLLMKTTNRIFRFKIVLDLSFRWLITKYMYVYTQTIKLSYDGVCFKIKLDGKLSAASVKTILDCMYTGKLAISEATVRDLLEASTYLKVHTITFTLISIFGMIWKCVLYLDTFLNNLEQNVDKCLW